MPRQYPHIQLARAGRPLFSIIKQRNATAPEEFAAEELRRHLSAICGTGPQLRNSAHARGPGAVSRIFINDHDAAEAAGIKTGRQALGQEAFHIETRGSDLYLLGGGPRGVLYGVYDILETLGCRWFTPEHRHIPLNPNLIFPGVKRTGRPAFEFRDAFAWDARDPLWWLRNRMNGWYTPVPECWGGHMDYGLFVHTFNTLLPPSEYFHKHPEYFSMIDGKRMCERSQLCLSNPDVLKIVTRNLLEHMRRNPRARLFSVSQNDWHGYCQCHECAKIAEAEGSQSGPLLRFVNAVARETVKHFPDNLIDTLAYLYTLDAPKHVRPHKNVRVRLCPILCCQGHEYGKCKHPESLRFLRALNEWTKITSNIYIWHYCTNFAHYPLPMADFDELSANLKLYRKKGVYGVFMQGMGEEGGGGESMALRAYVLSRLLWNPDQPVWPVVSEFLKGVCGNAADGIETYMKVFHDRVRKDRNLHPSLYDSPHHELFNEATLDKAEKGLAAARRRAATGHAKLYVDMLQNGIDYARLWRRSKVFYRRGNIYRSAKPADMKKLDSMIKIWKKAGVTHLTEAQPFEKSVLIFRNRLKQYKVEWIRDGKNRIAILPDFGGMILEWHFKGFQWLAPGEGYREFLYDTGQNVAGGQGCYRIVRRAAGRLALESDGEIRERRRYTLSGGHLATVSTLGNRGAETKVPQWHISLHMQLPENMLAGAVISFRDIEGTQVAFPWSKIPEGLAKAFVFEKGKRPAGPVRLSFEDGTSWIWNYDSNLADKTIIGRVSDKRILALDLRVVSHEIKPGKSIVFKQRVGPENKG